MVEEFSRSDKYDEYLRNQLNKAYSLMPNEGPYIIEARISDIEMIKSLVQGIFEVSIYDPIDLKFGGFILSNKDNTIHANMTLDMSMKKLEGHIFEYLDINNER